MNCKFCNLTLDEAGGLHRINPTGVKGSWACTPCINAPPPARCEIPGCKNTSRKWAGHEYLCSCHWRLVPSRLRRRRAKLRRMYARRPHDSNRYHRVNWVLWRAMVRAATHAAAGI